jgi:hypothetical protein
MFVRTIDICSLFFLLLFVIAIICLPKNSQRILQRKLQDINRFLFFIGILFVIKFILNVNHTFKTKKSASQRAFFIHLILIF